MKHVKWDPFKHWCDDVLTDHILPCAGIHSTMMFESVNKECARIATLDATWESMALVYFSQPAYMILKKKFKSETVKGSFCKMFFSNRIFTDFIDSRDTTSADCAVADFTVKMLLDLTPTEFEAVFTLMPSCISSIRCCNGKPFVYATCAISYGTQPPSGSYNGLRVPSLSPGLYKIGDTGVLLYSWCNSPWYMHFDGILCALRKPGKYDPETRDAWIEVDGTEPRRPNADELRQYREYMEIQCRSIPVQYKGGIVVKWDVVSINGDGTLSYCHPPNDPVWNFIRDRVKMRSENGIIRGRMDFFDGSKHVTLNGEGCKLNSDGRIVMKKADHPENFSSGLIVFE